MDKETPVEKALSVATDANPPGSVSSLNPLFDKEESKAEAQTELKALIEAEKGSEIERDGTKEFQSKVKWTCCFGKIKCTESAYILFLFTLTNVFLFADQNLLAPNLSVIADEFNFTDDERDTYIGGYISLGFFTIGGFVALVVGYFTDVMNRKYVFAGTVIVGELSCAATFWIPTGTVADFWSGLFLTRSITGIALGGALPVQFSLIGDLFNESQRGRAISFFAIANGIGVGFGQTLAGLLSPDWRLPFLIVSAPSFLLVAIFVATTKEPRRGQAETLLQGVKETDSLQTEEVNSAHKLDWKTFKSLFTRGSVSLIILQGLPGSLPWGMVNVFLNSFLIEEREQTPASAAAILTVFGLCTGASTVFGGWLVDKLWHKTPRLLPIIAGLSTAASIIPVHITLALDEQSLGTYYALLIAAGLLSAMAGPIVKSLLIHVTIPETRGTAFSLQTLLDEIGKGLGPFIVSALIVAAPTRTTGLIAATYGWAPTAIMQAAIAFFIIRDKAKNDAELKDVYADEIKEAEAQ